MATFCTKNGIEFSGIDRASHASLWSSLEEQFGLSTLQLVEGAAYSMAMVVRYALGLTAAEGKVITLASEGPAGCVALATMRHLVAAGADGIVLLEGSATPGGELSRQLFTLERFGIPLVPLSELLSDEPSRFLENCHNLICGCYSRSGPPSASLSKFVDLLNEAATPVHSVEAPLGVDVDSGLPSALPLYSSSTLSLGAPFVGLHAGRDFVGRHYLCDISCPRELYERFGQDLTQVFAEQPVVQITPKV